MLHGIQRPTPRSNIRIPQLHKQLHKRVKRASSRGGRLLVLGESVECHTGEEETVQQRAKEVDCAEEISGGSWYPLGRGSFSSGGGRGVITCDRLRLSEEIVHKVRRVVSRRGVFGLR